jgi:predicted dehydrogenase
MKKISIAQIGYGYWGRRLHRYFKNDNRFFLKYVYSRSFKGKNEFINDLDKIWDDKNISAVAIATPIKTHYSLAKKALLCNKNVLCEKPLALKAKEVLELKKIAEKKNLVLLTEFTYTFSKSLERAEKIIKKGTIGRIESVELSLKYAGRFLEYNVYWLLASHLLSILDIFIPLEKLKFKKIDFIKHNNRTETGIILFNNKNLTGKLTVSLNYPEKEMKAIIYGSKGTLVYNSMTSPSLRVICYKKTEGVLGDKLIVKDKSYLIDEKNNLKHAVDYFYKLLNKQGKTNIRRAVLITKILEGLNKIKI